MKPRPLSLSQSQLDLVLNAASGLRPDDRSRYLQAIADDLLPRKSFTTDDVGNAVQRVLHRLTAAEAAE